MAHQQEISEADWQRAKKRGGDAAAERRGRLDGDKDAASEMAAKLAAETYGARALEEENAFYQGFMGKLGF
jgi:hypothetical protein